MFRPSPSSQTSSNLQNRSEFKSKPKYLSGFYRSKQMGSSKTEMGHAAQRSSSSSHASFDIEASSYTPLPERVGRRALDICTDPASPRTIRPSMPSPLTNTPLASPKLELAMHDPQITDERFALKRLRSASMVRSNAQSQPCFSELRAIHTIFDDVFVISSAHQLPLPIEDVELELPALTSSPSITSDSSSEGFVPRSRNSLDSQRARGSWLSSLQVCRAEDVVFADDVVEQASVVISDCSESVYSQQSQRSSLDIIEEQLYSDLADSFASRDPLQEFERHFPASTRSEIGHGAASPMSRSVSIPAAKFSRRTSTPVSLGPLPARPSNISIPHSFKINARRSVQVRGAPSAGFFSLDETSQTIKIEQRRPAPDAPQDVRRPAPPSPRPILTRQSSATSSLSSMSVDEIPIATSESLVGLFEERAMEVKSRCSFEEEIRADEAQAQEQEQEQVPESKLQSRFSDDSDNAGESHEKRLSFMPSFGSFKTPSLSSTASSSIALRDREVRAATPDMSRSSSSISTASTTSSTAYTEQIFDLSRPSIDYRQVYALAHEYAHFSSDGTQPKNSPSSLQSSSSSPVIHSHIRPSLLRSKSQQQPSPLSFGFLAKSSKPNQCTRKDPLDRSYHLRRFA
ncbi:hypothetical protein BCV70DRAFT_27443 [Testicularia cyperi]|uniref:Uncharacterized protein n=1 Tax=Testicularia cyperi TaxID=1882483 RepID=A0A317XLU8_9BASI|nr:hypothetical protein BCV70DRAFT_27443 [Testicularia cyperi]